MQHYHSENESNQVFTIAILFLWSHAISMSDRAAAEPGSGILAFFFSTSARFYKDKLPTIWTCTKVLSKGATILEKSLAVMSHSTLLLGIEISFYSHSLLNLSMLVMLFNFLITLSYFFFIKDFLLSILYFLKYK